MKKEVYVPSMDGIPGIIPGTVIPIPEPVEIDYAGYVPVKEDLQSVYDGSNAVKTLNRRMMQK